MHFFVDAMQRGGPFMWPILVAAVFSLAIIGDRFYYVFFRADMDGLAFMAQVQKLILAGNVELAIKLCNNEAGRALPGVVRAGLSRASQGQVEVRRAIDEAVLEITPQLCRRTAFLPMIANAALLTGFLGTVQGVIMAFAAYTHAPEDTRQVFLANGIAVAMYTTAAGLFVAIPTFVLHGLVVQRAAKILDDIELYASRAANLLAAHISARELSEVAPAPRDAFTMPGS
jgi:biopolymer transport protein ExbB